MSNNVSRHGQIFNSHLGFEKILAELEKSFSTHGRQAATYPPYNVYRFPGGYRLEIAVAGFKKKDLSVTLDRKNHLMVISGRNDEEASSHLAEYEKLHSGLARRAFDLNINVSDDLEVAHASVEDGILSITLTAIEREEYKPLSIAIK